MCLQLQSTPFPAWGLSSLHPQGNQQIHRVKSRLNDYMIIMITNFRPISVQWDYEQRPHDALCFPLGISIWELKEILQLNGGVNLNNFAGFATFKRSNKNIIDTPLSNSWLRACLVPHLLLCQHPGESSTACPCLTFHLHKHHKNILLRKNTRQADSSSNS